MASSNTKTEQSEREIHDMISKLTDRLVRLGQGASEHDNNSHHPDNGVRIITLAGENKGAAMKATSMEDLGDTQGKIFDDESMMSAYTNSNYQAVNNSIMFEGKLNADDPGVHIVISEHVDDIGSSSDESDDEDGKGKKKKNKDHIKKEKEEKHSEDDEAKHSE